MLQSALLCLVLFLLAGCFQHTHKSLETKRHDESNDVVCDSQYTENAETLYAPSFHVSHPDNAPQEDHHLLCHRQELRYGLWHMYILHDSDMSAHELFAHNVKAVKKLTDAGKTVIIQGHASSPGSLEQSLHVSERCAQRCKSYLLKAGISPKKIWTMGYGCYQDPVIRHWSRYCCISFFVVDPET